MAKHYDLVIVSTGTAAMVAAMEVRAAGWSVAVIDIRLLVGRVRCVDAIPRGC